MRSQYERQDPVAPSNYQHLQVLSEVDRNPEITQRELAQRIGIALGLTNLLLRNLAQKGYVRVSQAGWKRWLYTLTPEGLSQKVRLTVGYVHRVLDHYHQVRQTLRDQLRPLALHKESTVAVYGTGEFAELVYLGLKEIGIEEIDIFDSAPSPDQRFLGMPVREVASLKPEDYDRVLVGLLEGTAAQNEGLLKQRVTDDKLVTFFDDG